VAVWVTDRPHDSTILSGLLAVTAVVDVSDPSLPSLRTLQAVDQW
jgi:hypothetical protein